MAKRPEERYQTPAEIAKDLTAVLKGNGSSPPKLEELKPADDFFAGLDLAAIPAGPASPLHTAALPVFPSRTNASADMTDWLAENEKLLAIIGAVAGSLLLAMLCVWGAGKYFGNESPKTAPRREVVNSNPMVKPAVTPGVVPVSPRPAVPLTSSKPRVLFCVPHHEIYETDFTNVMRTLTAGATVDVASTEIGPCIKYGGGVSEARPTLVIGKIAAEGYDAIIFCGANTDEFQGPATASLIREFANSEKKLVTAICKGQEVLAHHGYFHKDLRVAGSTFLKSQYEEFGCTADFKEPAIRDGNIITGQDDQAGRAFAELLLKTIREKNP